MAAAGQRRPPGPVDGDIDAAELEAAPAAAGQAGVHGKGHIDVEADTAARAGVVAGRQRDLLAGGRRGRLAGGPAAALVGGAFGQAGRGTRLDRRPGPCGAHRAP
ncbi:MAG: hypothetical protein AAFV86_24545, partial [Pseudomonadota bacterium]